MRRALIYLAAVACITITALQTSSVRAQEVKPPLERGAIVTERAGKSLLLGVTRAGKRIVVVGERGYILLSDDDGVSWRQAVAPTSVTLTAVAFAGDQEGWAVGHSGVVLHSEDGGESWLKQLDGRMVAQLVLERAEAEAKRGATDPGVTERNLAAAQQLVGDGPDKPFLDLYCQSEKTVLVIGAYNLAFRTDDGGETWRPWSHHVQNPKGLHLYAIRQAGSGLYIAGEQGLFLRSSDEGETFTAVSTPYEGTYFGLIPVANGELVLFGLRGHAFRSDDDGTTWETVVTGVQSSITDGIEYKGDGVILVTQKGDVLIRHAPTKGFLRIPVKEPFPFVGITEAENRNLILVGARGIKVLQANALEEQR